MVDSETTYGKLKKGLIELAEGYPDFMFFGKIEYFLGTREISIKVLAKDKIIELASKKEEKILNKKLSSEQLFLLKKGEKEKPDYWYRLTAKGVDLANSMINLEHSERMTGHSKKMLDYTKSIKTLTWVIVSVTILTFIIFIISLIN